MAGPDAAAWTSRGSPLHQEAQAGTAGGSGTLGHAADGKDDDRDEDAEEDEDHEEFDDGEGFSLIPLLSAFDHPTTLVGGGGLHRAGDPPWERRCYPIKKARRPRPIPRMDGPATRRANEIRFAVFAALAPDGGGRRTGLLGGRDRLSICWC